MRPDDKIDLIRDIVKLTKQIVEVPDHKLDMNDPDHCAFFHVAYLANSVSGEAVHHGLGHLSGKLFAVSFVSNDKYSNPRGEAGKIEFCNRAVKLINGIKDAQ